MQIIDVEVDASSVSIIFDRSVEDEFEIIIITVNLTITFLVRFVHRSTNQEVDVSLYAYFVSFKLVYHCDYIFLDRVSRPMRYCVYVILHY